MLHAQLLSNNRINHGFFTREGGVSEGVYAGLNCGYGSDDVREHVQENRLRVSRALGATSEVITCHQCHSATAHIIAEPPLTPLEGDALVTSARGLAIGVLTADCVPVLFADVGAGVVAAAHAGWKGAIGGILQSTIGLMENLGAKRKHIVAAIGPAIEQQSYEVGSDVFAKFMHEDYENGIFFKPSGMPDHYRFNLKGFVQRSINQQGVSQVETLPQDTYTNEPQFYSFRRTTHKGEKVYGRQISAIVLA